MIVIGHSGATGWNSDPNRLGTDARYNSWASGSNPAVDSIYQRLLPTNPGLRDHVVNQAVSGSKVTDLDTQLDAAFDLVPRPDLVLIQTVDNDIRCDGTDQDNYTAFGHTLSAALAKIDAQNPDASTLIVSSPWATVADYVSVVKSHQDAVDQFTGTGPCDLFDSSGHPNRAHMAYQQQVIDAYLAQVQKVCRQSPNCHDDRGALAHLKIDATDLTPDYNHLSIAGQAKQAAVEWPVLEPLVTTTEPGETPGQAGPEWSGSPCISKASPTPPIWRWSTAVASACVAVVVVLGGCAGNGPAAESPATPTTAAATAVPAPPESRDGMLNLASGVTVHYQCVGTGTPAILLEAGTDTAGTTSYGPGFIAPLAGAHQVCSYDRLGTGQSDPAPAHKRTIGDLCTLQHQVRDALRIGPTAALVGQSGGGNIVIWCAAQNPQAVAAVVTIEAYHDNPDDLANEGMSWRDNHEHVDWVDAATKLDQMPLPIGTLPVLVISASHADPGGAANQTYWLHLSPASRQVVVDGGHNLHQETPQRVANEILTTLPRT